MLLGPQIGSQGPERQVVVTGATEEVGRDNYCKVIGHDWHVEVSHGMMRLRCGNRCWIDREEYLLVKKERLTLINDVIREVVDLCDEWDRMSKGESPTTMRIRAIINKIIKKD